MDVSAFKISERWLLDGTTRQLFHWRESKLKDPITHNSVYEISY